MGGTSVKQIFISHAVKDADFAQRLAGDLQRLGVRVWIAPQSILPGEGWVTAIERGLRESSHVVIALTPDALESEWVEKETEVAIARERRGQIEVIPLEVEACQVPLLLSSYQMVSFRRGYDVGFSQLAGRLGLRVAPPEGIERPKPTGRRSGRVLPLALAALLVLVICVVVIGVLASGLVGFPGGLIPIPTTPAPVVVNTPISTPTPASSADTPTPVPPAPTPTSVPPTPTPVFGIGTILMREKDGMEMVYVPGGTFQMGSNDGEAHEQPVHAVTLDGFWIDGTEVTNAQYARCVADGMCSPPPGTRSFTRDSYYGDSRFDGYPVIYMGWDDADTYCRWAEGRLPTEAEWEYAARGRDNRVYPWGNDPPRDTLLNYDNTMNDTTEVGSYPAGASWVGAMDMAGNVWEWVSDWYDGDYYANSPSQSPQGPNTGSYRILRGGGFRDVGSTVRAAFRGDVKPLSSDRSFGFRCVVPSTASP